VDGLDKVYGEAEGPVMEALEARSMCGGHRPSAWQAEQERRLSDTGFRWGHCTGRKAGVREDFHPVERTVNLIQNDGARPESMLFAIFTPDKQAFTAHT
jgi:hypothetical protein